VARFASEEEARQAEEKNSLECGYHESVVFCKVCDAWHVAHRYSADPAPASQGSGTMTFVIGAQ
jgi:3-phosphoglycerate kinase